MAENADDRGISRRAFTRLLGAAGAGMGLAGLGGGTASATEHERPFSTAPGRWREQPNILVILGDDLGWADLSSYGAPEIRTPHLDRLARGGVRFTQAYSGSATCSPTRFSLYTGRYPGRLRGGLAEPIAAPNALEGIPEGWPTLASLLRGVGYSTALIGKWHCGYLPWFSPTRAGWDEFFGNFAGALDYFSKLDGEGRYDLYEGEVEHQDLRYYTDVITERAVEYVGREHDKPWLLNLNFTTPHWPWEGRRDRAVSNELSARIRAGEKQVLFHRDGGSLAKYREMVENLDASVGEVLHALDRSGAAHNTLVFFASDNGGERFSYYWPLSGGKGNLQEGGIRVPTILRWPAAGARRAGSRARPVLAGPRPAGAAPRRLEVLPGRRRRPALRPCCRPPRAGQPGRQEPRRTRRPPRLLGIHRLHPAPLPLLNPPPGPPPNPHPLGGGPHPQENPR